LYKFICEKKNTVIALETPEFEGEDWGKKRENRQLMIGFAE
jgi:hypothetical protein